MKGRAPQPAMQRILQRTEIVPGPLDTPCWVWTGAGRRYGYIAVGSIADGSYRNARVHRVAYEHLVGPVPADLVLDHLCKVPKCLNPDHLQPVTQRVNLLRGDTITAQHAAKTHCIHGHAFDASNTRRDRRGRRCRTCERICEERRVRRGRIR